MWLGLKTQKHSKFRNLSIPLFSSKSTMLPVSSLIERRKMPLDTSDEVFTVMYFVKAAAAGGICTSLTHGAVTPMDVVKTRIQLDPVKYNRGFIGTFQQIVQAEGPGALLTGFGATAAGYFVQGWVS